MDSDAGRTRRTRVTRRQVLLLTTFANRPLPNFSAGQHIIVQPVEKFGEGEVNRASTSSLIRCYTLSGLPNPRFWRITVKRQSDASDKDTLVRSLSSYLHTCLKPGDQLRVKGPNGSFTLAGVEDAPLSFFAAGIGITPFISLAHDALTKLPHRSVQLFYQSQTPETAALSRELMQLARQYRSLQITVAFSKLNRAQATYDDSKRVRLVGGKFSPSEVVGALPTHAGGTLTYADLCNG